MPFPNKKKKRDDYSDDEFDIDDIDTYRGEPDLKYSHELIVMEQLRRCLKAGSQEMKKGWEERKSDRMGGIISIKTHPDTRKEFGECVNSLKNVMKGHIDPDPNNAKGNIEKLYGELDKLKEHLIEEEEKAWGEIPDNVKRYGSNWMDRWDHINGTLNYDHIYGEKYLQESVAVYRRILEAIIALLHAMGYFKADLLM